MSKAQFTRRLALCGLAANAVALPLTISGAIRNSGKRSFQSLDNDTVEFFAAKKANEKDRDQGRDSTTDHHQKSIPFGRGRPAFGFDFRFCTVQAEKGRP